MSDPTSFKRQNQLYQPVLNSVELARLKAGEFEAVSTLVRARSEAERVCVDRLGMIMRNLPKPLGECSVLDLGCANGFFCNALAFLGAKSTTGVDSDAHKSVLGLDVESALTRAHFDARQYGISNSQFIDREIGDFVLQDRPEVESDITIFFSVLHHLFHGYGFLNHSEREVLLGESPRTVLQWIDRHTRGYLFFEIHEGIFADWRRDTIPEQIMKFTTFTSVTHLGDSDAYEQSPRGVWLCRRDVKLK